MIDIRKDEQAFSGIEAAIVLIAFIAVAVIFSYVLMGLGQSASDEAKSQTLAGIDTIAFAPSGIKGLDTTENGKIDNIEFWMYGGNSRLDMATITMDFMTKENTYMIQPAGDKWREIYKKNADAAKKEQWIVKKYVGDEDQLLEKGERVLVSVGLDGEGGITPNEEFSLKILGETGPLYTISGKAPTVIDPVNQISIL